MGLHLRSDLEANCQRFITRVKASGVVWGLRSQKGWAVCSSNEYDCYVMPFWSDEAYARRLASNEWSQYLPASIALDAFVGQWLHGMHTDGMLVGVNFNADMAGIEMEPFELVQALAD